jgi:hypothetical protein
VAEHAAGESARERELIVGVDVHLYDDLCDRLSSSCALEPLLLGVTEGVPEEARVDPPPLARPMVIIRHRHDQPNPRIRALDFLEFV